jgi:hypothetical protein
MQSLRRKPFNIGGSRGVTLPPGMKIGHEVSVAAGNRLLIMDTSGEVQEDKLLQFFMDYVEPAFQHWQDGQKGAVTPSGGFRVLQQEKPQTVVPVKSLEAEGVAMPQPDVPVVSCFRCGQMMTWTLDPHSTAACPQCGTILRLVVLPQIGGTP